VSRRSFSSTTLGIFEILPAKPGFAFLNTGLGRFQASVSGCSSGPAWKVFEARLAETPALRLEQKREVLLIWPLIPQSVQVKFLGWSSGWQCQQFFGGILSWRHWSIVIKAEPPSLLRRFWRSFSSRIFDRTTWGLCRFSGSFSRIDRVVEKRLGRPFRRIAMLSSVSEIWSFPDATMVEWRRVRVLSTYSWTLPPW